MKKLLLATIAAGLFFAVTAQASQAGTQDVAKITCEELLKQDQKSMGMLLMWMDGYMSAKSDNTEFSEEWMGKLGKHMGTYCGKNPKKTIMEAMEAMPSE